MIGYLWELLLHERDKEPPKNKTSNISIHKKTYGGIINVTSQEDLKSKLRDAGSSLVVIEFFSEKCRACKLMLPFMEKFVKEFEDVMFLQVDVFKLKDIVKEYDIHCTPVYVFIKSETKLETFIGANEEKVRAFIVKYNT